MSPADYVRLADALLPAVLAAGRIEMRYYTGVVTIEHKADNSPVTAADREAEAVLVEALARVEPLIPVIAEEASAAGRQPVVGETFFLVDPLDGTREFIAKRGEFTVNIGMIAKGEPVFGIVFAPALSRLFATLGPSLAVAAEVAADSSASSFADLHARTITARAADPARLVAVASRSHRMPETDAYLARFQVADYKPAGSSLKFCLLAEGAADLYPRHGTTAEWDTAAGHAILAAAGGHVLTMDGAPLRYGKAGDKFLNPHFVAWGRDIVEPGS